MYSLTEIEKADIGHKEVMKKRWHDLEADLASRTSPDIGRDIIAALRDMQELMTRGDVVSWFANLYDPVTGGFYYSNSARDNARFLPDLESTRQVMSFFAGSGMADEFGGNAIAALPEWVRDGFVKFVKERQDVNGYFYHPQWSKEETDAHLPRLGRDLDWAVNLLKMCGAKPTYDTPNGMKGDGLLWDGTPAPDYKRTFCGVEDGEHANDDLVKPHLKDKESFMAYLGTFEENDEIHKNSWRVGNTLESQARMILDRDRVLKERGADYSLCDILADWFAKHQNPATGAWTRGDEVSTDSTNGLLKIASAFNRIERELPNPLICIETAIKVIKTTDSIPTICHALNPWYALTTIVENVRKFGTSSDKEHMDREIKMLKQHILENAAEMIRISAAKLSALKMEDGSFEFTANGKNGYAQGMPISVQDLHEGNVNAYICTRAVPAHIYNLLGYKNMQLFGEADRMRFVNILEERRKTALV